MEIQLSLRKAHLVEYVIGKYRNPNIKEPIISAKDLLIYSAITNRLCPMPPRREKIVPNLTILLKDQHRGVGIDFRKYNYIYPSAMSDIELGIEVAFWTEAHEFLNTQRYKYNRTFKEASQVFLEQYDIESLTHFAILKRHDRWKEALRPRQEPTKSARSKN